MDKNDHIFINGINQMDMVLGRFIVRNKYDRATKIMEETKKYFINNKNLNYQVVAESLEILIHHYSDIQSKIPLESKFGKEITKYYNYYATERKKIKI